MIVTFCTIFGAGGK